MLDPALLIARQNSASRDTSARMTTVHCILDRVTNSMRFVADQGNNHTVQVEEKHQEVETKFDERFLIIGQLAFRVSDDVNPEQPTFLCTLSLRKISVASKRCALSKILYSAMSSYYHHS